MASVIPRGPQGRQKPGGSNSLHTHRPKRAPPASTSTPQHSSAQPAEPRPAARARQASKKGAGPPATTRGRSTEEEGLLHRLPQAAHRIDTPWCDPRQRKERESGAQSQNANTSGTQQSAGGCGTREARGAARLQLCKPLVGGGAAENAHNLKIKIMPTTNHQKTIPEERSRSKQNQTNHAYA